MPKTSASKKPVSKTASKSNGKAINKETLKKSGAFTPEADMSLKELFVSALRDTYWSENHLVKAIPKMVAAVGATGLKQALQEHLEVTMTHVSRLEEVFELLGEKFIAKKCDACEGLTISGEHVIENTVTGTSTRDTAIIMSALKVENFEITTYKGLIQLATTLNKTDVAELLQQTLDEEIEASDLLTEMSQAGAEKEFA